MKLEIININKRGITMQVNTSNNNYSLLIDIMSQLLQNHLDKKNTKNEEESTCSKNQ